MSFFSLTGSLLGSSVVIVSLAADVLLEPLSEAVSLASALVEFASVVSFASYVELFAAASVFSYSFFSVEAAASVFSSSFFLVEAAASSFF